MRSREDILYVVMPAYNEEENIEAVIRSWYPIVEKHGADGASRLVIFNDGSKDNTRRVVSGLMNEFPLLEAVDKENSGHGPTVITAYRYAVEAGAEWIFRRIPTGRQTRKNLNRSGKTANDMTGFSGSG